MSVLAGKELRIVGFLCNWCSYGGADTAGTARAVQPTDLRIIRVPCSGRVNPLFVLKALINGADGVLVSGCHPRDCHYSAGNYYARRRLEMLKQFLPVLGINPDRFEYTWVSASEGQRWKDVASRISVTAKAVIHARHKALTLIGESMCLRASCLVNHSLILLKLGTFAIPRVKLRIVDLLNVRREEPGCSTE